MKRVVVTPIFKAAFRWLVLNQYSKTWLLINFIKERWLKKNSRVRMIDYLLVSVYRLFVNINEIKFIITVIPFRSLQESVKGIRRKLITASKIEISTLIPYLLNMLDEIIELAYWRWFIQSVCFIACDTCIKFQRGSVVINFYCEARVVIFTCGQAVWVVVKFEEDGWSVGLVSYEVVWRREPFKYVNQLRIMRTMQYIFQSIHCILS